MKGIRKLFYKKRAGTSLVECMLLIIIVVFVLGAVLRTSFATTRLEMAGRQYVNSHKAAVSFFEALETIDASDIKGDILTHIQDVISIDTRYICNPEIIEDKDTGVTRVKLTVLDSETSSKEIVKYFNNFSTQTVSDDRITRG